MKNSVLCPLTQISYPHNVYNSASLKYGVVKSCYNKAHSATLSLKQET